MIFRTSAVIYVGLALKFASALADCVDINTASLKELQGIIHIDKARAQQIIDDRPWASVPQLRRIDGIGASRLYHIRSEGGACVDGVTEHVMRGRAEVLDGDTIVIRGEVLRLLGMDAPEASQSCTANNREWPCGDLATAALRDLVSDRKLECRSPDRDRYSRWLAVCHHDDGLEINSEMVRLGWALVYRPGDDPFPRPEYEPQETEARDARRGIWRGEFVQPWVWRRQVERR